MTWNGKTVLSTMAGAAKMDRQTLAILLLALVASFVFGWEPAIILARVIAAFFLVAVVSRAL